MYTVLYIEFVAKDIFCACKIVKTPVYESLLIFVYITFYIAAVLVELL